MAAANQSDFLGEGVVTSQPLLPKERATTPDGLNYLDTGEPTPLYYARQQLMHGGSGDANWDAQLRASDRAFAPSYVPGQDRVRAPGSEDYVFDAKSGTWVIPGKHGRPGLQITNDPARQQQAMETPIYSVNGNIGTGDNRNMFPLAPGAGTIPGRQGTQAEANRANAYYAATGNSTPPGGATSIGAGIAGLGDVAAAAQRNFNGIQQQRGTQAQDMFAQGAATQDRTAAQTGYVSYGGPQSVAASNAGVVDYGAQQRISAPTLAQAQQAAMGNFGGQQSVSASNVGPAAQGSVGNFGAQQSVSAARVAAAQQAQAQQAQAYQAQNQAGFLAGTAQGARDIADLDFSLANESRTAMGDSLNRIRGFVDQGPGESQAQAQLRMAQEQNLGDALSLARSGRGNAAGNMKMAISENAATNAQTNQQAALLRANEADLWRGRQLQGLGLEQQGTTAMRGQDIGMATAQGQHAVSREQIASNVDVSRAGLEQGLAQFNAGAQNQASLTNANLGTQTSIANAEQTNLGSRLQAQLSTDASIQQAALANARNIAVGQAGTQVSMGNAEQQNLGSRLNAQLSTDAAIQQAALANSRNIAMGQAGTQVGISNAEQSNLTSRLQGQLQSDAGIQQASLANQLAIARGDSATQIGVTNANNQSTASRAQAELANALAIAQGNSSTDINRANLDAQVRQREANDKLQSDLYGYGVDYGNQQINAANYGAANAYDYANLGAEIDWRNLDRAAGVKTAEQDRKQKQEAAYISALAATLAGIA